MMGGRENRTASRQYVYKSADLTIIPILSRHHVIDQKQLASEESDAESPGKGRRCEPIQCAISQHKQRHRRVVEMIHLNKRYISIHTCYILRLRDLNGNNLGSILE